MAEITSDQISHLAALSRLALTAEEEARFAQQLSGVVEYVDLLSQVNTVNSVQEGVSGKHNVFAEDISRLETDQLFVDRELLLRGAPARQGEFIEVRAVMSDESEES